MTASPTLAAVRTWAAGFPERRNIGRLFRDRNFLPIPFDGPRVGACCWVVALAADRTGVVALDSGGGTEHLPWETVFEGST